MKNPFETPEEAASRKAAAKRGNECMLREPWDFSNIPIMRERDIHQLHLDRLEEERLKLLRTLTDRTGMPVTQENGQRRYGPPLDPYAPLPEKGSEVFVGRIPRDCFEPELVPIFEQAGQIYELRLMMDFSGTNRGYCFVNYFTKYQAQLAIQILNNYEIRRGHHLGVVKSVDNCRLLVSSLPRDKDSEEIRQKILKLTSGVVKVIAYPSPDRKEKSRGFAIVEYESHKIAAMARRKLYPGRLQMWSVDIGVDWAEPEPDGAVLFVRNLQRNHSESFLQEVFNQVSEFGVTKVKIVRDFAFVYFSTNEQAEMAKITLEYCDEYSDLELQVFWAKSKSQRQNRVFGKKVRINFDNPNPTNPYVDPAPIIQPDMNIVNHVQSVKWNRMETITTWDEFEIGYWNRQEAVSPRIKNSQWNESKVEIGYWNYPQKSVPPGRVTKSQWNRSKPMSLKLKSY